MGSWLSKGEKAAHYRLSSSDRPGEQLVPRRLKESVDNYITWKLSMTMALIAKQKIAYVNGQLPKPPPGDPNELDWTICNSMVICWILNSIHVKLLYMLRSHFPTEMMNNSITARALWMNLENLFQIQQFLAKVKAVHIDNAITLAAVTSQIFEMALMEPTFCDIYASFCLQLSSSDELPEFTDENNEKKITFKRLLVNKCQEVFERREIEEEEANVADEEREERRMKARRRMLGNIRLIGELCKKSLLSKRIMHHCITELLAEEDIEGLCMLMRIIGEMMDHQAKLCMDVYFERMKLLSNKVNLCSRLRFMLKDVIDLRNNKWQQRMKVKGPEKIEEVHRECNRDLRSTDCNLDRHVATLLSSTQNASSEKEPAIREYYKYCFLCAVFILFISVFVSSYCTFV